MKNMTEVLEDLLRAYFGTLILTGILFLLIWVGANAGLEKTKEWAMGQANTVIGAIIMLTTGKAVQRMANTSSKVTTEVEVDKEKETA